MQAGRRRNVIYPTNTITDLEVIERETFDPRTQLQRDLDLSLEFLVGKIEPNKEAREYMKRNTRKIEKILGIVNMLMAGNVTKKEFEKIKSRLDRKFPTRNPQYSTFDMLLMYALLVTRNRMFFNDLEFREAVLFHGNPLVSEDKNLQYRNTILLKIDGNLNGSPQNKTKGYMAGWIIYAMNNTAISKELLDKLKESVERYSDIFFD